uniref:Thioredoxin domain-containing protein n=2 Tax=Biomphalaria glabrata TaxID=6526 RepID=A0A2C9JBY6_BIOGL
MFFIDVQTFVTFLVCSTVLLFSRGNPYAESTEKLLRNQCFGEDCIEDVKIADSKWLVNDKNDETREGKVDDTHIQEGQESVDKHYVSTDDINDIQLVNVDNSPKSDVARELDPVDSREHIEPVDYVVNQEANEIDTSEMNEIPILEAISDQDEVEDDDEQDSEQIPQRRRYFPLLYTFKTLLNSFLSDFGEDSSNQDGSYNTSDTTNGSLSVSEDLIKDSNMTVNGTDGGKKTRFQCTLKNTTANTQGKVKIVNSTELLEILNFSKNQKVSTCVLVMFYAPWCHFCARTAPHYNALARAFPQLDVLAVDTSHFSYLNARFGTVAVPNVMLFHLRSAVRFNHTIRVLENFSQFVTNNTGLLPDKHVKLEPTDFVGPLPSVVVRGRDWLLWLSWTFVIMCSTYSFVRSHYGQNCITRLRILWQEHQHIE